MCSTGRVDVLLDIAFNVVFLNEMREWGWIGSGWSRQRGTKVKIRLENAYAGSPQELAMEFLCNTGDASALNAYTLKCVPLLPSVQTHFNSITTSFGTATILSAYCSNLKSDGVMIRHSAVKNGSRANYNIGGTLTHEDGHWLQLFRQMRLELEIMLRYAASDIWLRRMPKTE
ncbi:hypothetical protein CPC08DRAFT_730179 [Agrocybe pediades]|nr:hypothetical protein CPC08DRAFT_730179 [Agrocybe pediades]